MIIDSVRVKLVELKDFVRGFLSIRILGRYCLSEKTLESVFALKRLFLNMKVRNKVRKHRIRVYLLDDETVNDPQTEIFESKLLILMAFQFGKAILLSSCVKSKGPFGFIRKPTETTDHFCFPHSLFVFAFFFFFSTLIFIFF